MLETAWYFLSGFFGLSWAQVCHPMISTQKSTERDLGIYSRRSWFQQYFGLGFGVSCISIYLLPFSLQRYYNGLSLQGHVDNSTSNPVVDAIEEWQYTYLANATSRLKPLVTGYNWTYSDSFNAQAMCTYEIIAFGYSSFCSLFTADEWIGFGYAQDLLYFGTVGYFLTTMSTNNKVSNRLLEEPWVLAGSMNCMIGSCLSNQTGLSPAKTVHWMIHHRLSRSIKPYTSISLTITR